MIHRVLELFAGIGGLHAAWPDASVAAAYDINAVAGDVYRRNFPRNYRIQELGAVSSAELLQWDCDTWWMSPPCQPYCRLGNQRDEQDSRASAFLHLIDCIDRCQPHALALENVIGFESSVSWKRLNEVLQSRDYCIRYAHICPSMMGWPNRRPRFYLIASQEKLPAWRPLPRYSLQLQEILDPQADQSEESILWLGEKDQRRFFAGLDRTSRQDRSAKTACFTSSYGKALLRAGSYLQVADRYRRFTPREVARLLGFSDHFQLGPHSFRRQWKLLGQSLSLPVVRYVISHLPGGPSELLAGCNGITCEATTRR